MWWNLSQNVRRLPDKLLSMIEVTGFQMGTLCKQKGYTSWALLKYLLLQSGEKTGLAFSCGGKGNEHQETHWQVPWIPHCCLWHCTFSPSNGICSVSSVKVSPSCWFCFFLGVCVCRSSPKDLTFGWGYGSGNLQSQEEKWRTLHTNS